MKDNLTRIAAYIGQHPIAALRDSLRLCSGADGVKDPAQEVSISLLQIMGRGQVPPGDDQQMNRGLGLDIPKGEEMVILIYLGRWNLSSHDLTKNAIR